MNRLMTFETYSILGRVEKIKITNDKGESIECDAKIDTGSYSSRISSDIAKQLKLPVVDNRKIKSSLGEEDRIFVELQFNINGIEIKTQAGISDMDELRNQVSIGRKDIEMVDGIVDVKKSNNINESKEEALSNLELVKFNTNWEDAKERIKIAKSYLLDNSEESELLKFVLLNTNFEDAKPRLNQVLKLLGSGIKIK